MQMICDFNFRFQEAERVGRGGSTNRKGRRREERCKRKQCGLMRNPVRTRLGVKFPRRIRAENLIVHDERRCSTVPMSSKAVEGDFGYKKGERGRKSKVIGEGGMIRESRHVRMRRLR